LNQALANPSRAFPEILKLARSSDWKEREVAATILVEAGKKRPHEIVTEMILWADHEDPNVRRTASEGLRGIARKQPEMALPVITKLKADAHLYVKKSVANVLRNAGNYHPDFVFSICAEWARDGDADTAWIVKDGLRKLKMTFPKEVDRIVSAS
jgi:3-methyladenine DNA glycosylase AlkC